MYTKNYTYPKDDFVKLMGIPSYKGLRILDHEIWINWCICILIATEFNLKSLMVYWSNKVCTYSLFPEENKRVINQSN